MLVLDTHVWLWAVAGTRKLQTSALTELAAAARRNDVRVPIIAVWEIGMLDSRGRIALHQPVRDWVSASLAFPGYGLAQLTPEIALLSHRLPGTFHADPIDRLIVATAIELGAVLVTRDSAILAYGAQGHVQVLAA